MSIKAALFACVIAAGFGCRDSARSSEDNGYAQPIESAGVPETGTGRGAGVEPAVEPAEPAVDVTGTANENTGADVTTGRSGQGEVQGRRTVRATRGSTMGFGGRYVAPNKPASAPYQPSSGLNETSSGNGTTTNTGTNTENAGNGNTDNPNQ